jgi:hypothetical protein
MLSEKKSVIELAASKLLAIHGVRAIWDLHGVAAAAYGMGEPEMAEMMTELADAAERQWSKAHQMDGAVAPVAGRL